MTTTSVDSSNDDRAYPPILPRILSGSVGSLVTALAVTPLEVVKIRQQIANTTTTTTTTTTSSMGSTNPTTTTPVRSPPCLCILNNGLMECIVNRKHVPYLTQIDTSRTATSNTTTPTTRSIPSWLSYMRQSIPRWGASTTSTATASTSTTSVVSRNGTFTILRNIYATEGFAGVYAGLAPTLVMSVPNTVLYFTAYDEIKARLENQRIRRVSVVQGPPKSLSLSSSLEIVPRVLHSNVTTLASSADSQVVLVPWWIPLLAGSLARLVASGVTAPLELVRTRQAVLGSSGGGASASASPGGLWMEFQHIVRVEGITALYQGLGPTLWRDVPFSAIYWFCLEQFKMQWKRTTGGIREQHPHTFALVQAGQSFINGAVAGMIAAACTTPFDVVKTRRQTAMLFGTDGLGSGNGVVLVNACRTTCTTITTSSALYTESPKSNSTFVMLKQILHEEGVAGLWRGNTTRMIKVAPACAIMISCYEMGKLLLE